MSRFLSIVISRADSQERTDLIRLFISIANECLNLGNYHAVFVIMSGLSLGPVYRLTHDWNELGWVSRRTFGQLKSICSYERNYCGYRSHFASRTGSLPHLAVVNKDIFANEQLPTTNEKGLSLEPQEVVMSFG